jgi:hypothetical protein
MEKLTECIKKEIEFVCLSNGFGENERKIFLEGIRLFSGLPVSSITEITKKINIFVSRNTYFTAPVNALGA